MADKQLIDQLAALRKNLSTADIQRQHSLADAFSAFLDLAEGTDLVFESRRAEDALVEATILRVMRHFTGDDGLRIERLHMLSYAAAGMVHGGFSAGGQMGTFFFFTDEGQGMLALNSGGPRTDYCRITSTPLPAGSVPMRRPRGVQ